MRRSSDDLTQGIAASGGSLDLTVGYAARPGWFVVAELFVGMGSPRYSRDGASQPGDTGALLAHGYAGLGLAHDLSWQQITVQATAGPSRMIYVSPQAVGWTKTGAMVSAAASRNVHLGQRWSVGAALLGQLGVIPDLAGPTWTSAQLSLMVQVSVD